MFVCLSFMLFVIETLLHVTTIVSKLEFTTFSNYMYHEMSTYSIRGCNLFTGNICYLHTSFHLFVTFSSGWLFRVATFELIVAHWGVRGDDLEHLYKNTFILWHGNGRRRLNSIVFASFILLSLTIFQDLVNILQYSLEQHEH